MSRRILLSVIVVFVLIAGIGQAQADLNDSGPNAMSYQGVCSPPSDSILFCDEFTGRTFYINPTTEHPGNPAGKALWWQYPYNRDNGTVLYEVNSGGFIRLQLNENVSSNYYSNADISTSEINNINGNFLFGENVRVEVRMRYSPNMHANADNPGSAWGSAGFIFWNYFTVPGDPELKNLNAVRDAFGFTWQDGSSVPNPGFWMFNVAQTVPGNYVYYPNIDLSQFHTYVLERRHHSMRFFIDGQLVHEEPLNQPGAIQLPAESKLTIELWTDNATYLLDMNTYYMDLVFRDLTEPQYVDIDYVIVTRLNS